MGPTRNRIVDAALFPRQYTPMKSRVKHKGIAVVLFLAMLLPGAAVLLAQDAPETVYGWDVDPWELNPRGLYALGWAPTGLFAYATYSNYDEAMGPGINLVVVVQNMITDEIVDRLSISEPRSTEPSFEEAWEFGRDRIAAFLDSYQIERSGTSLERFPHRHGNTRFDADLQLDGDPEEDPVFGSIRGYQVWIESSSGGSKRITGAVSQSSYGGYIAVEIPGYFASPFEPRLAVLIVEVNRGWEGPPNDLGYTLSGAHLERGF